MARLLSKTLAIDSRLVVWDGPRNLVYATEGDGAIMQSVSAGTIDEEAARWSVSLGVEYHSQIA